MAIADQARGGIAPPHAFPKGPAEPDLIIRFAQRAEVLGYDSLWVQDRMLGHATWLEPLNMLSFMAAATNTIRLGVATLPLPWHNPVRLAKALVTLDQLSGGRLTVGLSLGGTYLNDTIGGAVPE